MIRPSSNVMCSLTYHSSPQVPFSVFALVSAARRHRLPPPAMPIMPDVLANARAACYKARDDFYSCLERDHGNKPPTELATMGLLYPADCRKARDVFVASCRPTWVKHFDRQYCAKKRVQRLLDNDEARRGPISLPQPPFKS